MTCDRNMCYQQEYNDGGCDTCLCDDERQEYKKLNEQIWSKDVEVLEND